MKRQDSLPSSSSHRENNINATEKLHAKAVGCMSGLFHFVSNYHSRRKFLTFGKRQEKNEVASSTSSSSGKTKSSSTRLDQTYSPPSMVKGDLHHHGRNVVVQRFSCEVPRSPTLPPEIRRSNSVNSLENFRAPTPAPSALVARLMGLEEAPATTKTTSKALRYLSAAPEYSAAEKRRQLLGALEKCDRDLKALKKIIDAVRSAERLRSPAVVFRSSEADGHANGGGKSYQGVKGLELNNADQPSPVSVLDEFTRSPLSNYNSKRHSYNYGRMQHQLIRQQKKKPGEEDFIGPSIFDRITCELLQRKAIYKVSTDSHNAETATSLSLSLSSSPPPSSSSSPLWSSKAMKESVEEVCKDIAWGERREMGRIGLALQDHICRDLIEEIVTDLSSYHFCNNMYSSLPFEACKRRLCF